MPHEPTDPTHRMPCAEVVGDRPRTARRPILISTPPPVGGVRRVHRRGRLETRPRTATTHWFCTTLLREV